MPSWARFSPSKAVSLRFTQLKKYITSNRQDIADCCVFFAPNLQTSHGTAVRGAVGSWQCNERGTADIHPRWQHQLASLLPGGAAALWAPSDPAPREPRRPPLGRTTYSRSHSVCTPSSSCSCRRSSTCAATLTHLSPLLVARPALTPRSKLPHTAAPTCCVCSPRPSRRARAPRRAAVLPAASAAPIAAAVAVAAASRAVAVAVAATSEARAAPPHCTARRPTAPPPLRSPPLPSHRALPVRAQAWAL